LHTVEVAGSIPAPPTIQKSGIILSRLIPFLFETDENKTAGKIRQMVSANPFSLGSLDWHGHFSIAFAPGGSAG
ncbi:MAG TPA: hypothetical protein PLR47_08160, partial [Smithellaceae bacterium]|nr:hypothetical protein [Smithellaceae bacterium]